MNYCGLDIAGVSSYVFVTDGQGRKLSSGPVATTKAALEARLRSYLRGGLAVAIEAGNQTAWIYEVLVGRRSGMAHLGIAKAFQGAIRRTRWGELSLKKVGTNRKKILNRTKRVVVTRGVPLEHQARSVAARMKTAGSPSRQSRETVWFGWDVGAGVVAEGGVGSGADLGDDFHEHSLWRRCPLRVNREDD